MSETITAWSSLAVAVIAFVALLLTARETRSAQREAQAETRRRADQAVAALDREQVLTLARLHGAQRDATVYLSPAEQGQIGAALDALPAGSLPLCRSWAEGELRGERSEDWDEVRIELSREIRRLTTLSAGPAKLEAGKQ
jgi:hypothetical protein